MCGVLVVMGGCGARSALPEGAGLPVTGTTSGSGGSKASGASGTGASGTGASGAGGCGGLPGPAMVTIPLPDGGSYCIDSTEVSRADYHAFVAAGPPLSLQPACCSWNVTYYKEPGTPWAGPDSVPAIFVNWCDAFAYCAWAGKRLCGKIGGGSVAFEASTDPMQSQWLYACTEGGAKKFPYGSSPENTACVTYDLGSNVHQLEPVGSSPGFVGGFPGLFDMSGNVGEWDDSAMVTVCGEYDTVVMRGGSLANFAYDADCALRTSTIRLASSNLGGFRCCKD